MPENEQQPPLVPPPRPVVSSPGTGVPAARTGLPLLAARPRQSPKKGTQNFRQTVSTAGAGGAGKATPKI